MISSSKYEKNTRSNQPWIPKSVEVKTLNNRNSVKHNIISHQPNKNSAPLDYASLTTHRANRTKGLAEFNDKKRLTNENVNYDHLEAMKGNQDVFKRKDGIFTHLYNSAARFGEDKPFKA